MSVKHRLIDALLRSYPAEWRQEYGAELADLLTTHRLGIRVVADVLWSGFQQRVWSREPATVLGLAALCASLGLMVTNVIAPHPYGGWTTVLEPSSMTFPTVRVSPIVGEVFSVLFICCGYWTRRHRGATPPEAGRAAATLCLLAGIPLMVVGALMLLGVIGLSVVGPGGSAFAQHGVSFTYYSATGNSPSPLSVMLFPVSRVPIAWLWGLLGGHVASWTPSVEKPRSV